MPTAERDFGPQPLGQWAGPYNTGRNPMLIAEYAEIAHATVLPPPLDDTELSTAQRQGMTRVAFMCRSHCDPAPLQSHLFIWNVDQPNDPLQVVVLTNSPTDGSGDSFCSGGTLMPDGDWFSAGGLDYDTKCHGDVLNFPCLTTPGTNPEIWLPVGHRFTYRVETNVDPPSLLTSWTVLLDRERYYSTVLLTQDGNPRVLGHTGSPNDADIEPCPAPYALYPYGDPVDARTQELDWQTGATVISEPNGIKIGTNCAFADPLPLGDYPRAHMTSTKWLVHTNASSHTSPATSQFLRLDPPSCPGASPEHRWEKQTGTPPSLLRAGGSSVHLIIRDEDGEPVDLIYDVGGIGPDGKDDNPGEFPQYVSASVELLTSPEPSANWTTVPSLNNPSVNHQTLILPNAELVCAGGQTDEADVPHLPEIYRPVAIFDTPLPDDEWKYVAPLTWGDYGTVDNLLRTYHSVGGVLLDGRAFLGGGIPKYPDPDETSHWVHIYSPWYCFVDRPSITNWPKPPPFGTGIAYDPDEDPNDPLTAFTLTVSLPEDPPVPIDRVVLLRPSSATHAFDANQLYVELKFEIDQVNGSTTTLRVGAPADGYLAPPGFYGLFVVNQLHVPSVGRWVKVGQ